MGIRLAVLDDNPHVTWEGHVHPVDATFHRFLTALLDVPGEPVSRLLHVVPLRAAERAPGTLAVDSRIETVATAPFSGIADYLWRWPLLVARNARPLRRAIRDADLLLLRLPASNALLAAALAARAGRPRFGYVAGSARDVASARALPRPGRWVALAIGEGYDRVARVAAGPRNTIRVGEALLHGGVVTSLVEPGDIRGPWQRGGVPDAGPAQAPGEPSWPSAAGALRLAWAGRVVSGKGLETLVEALAVLETDRPDGRRPTLLVLGDGPQRARIAGLAETLGVGDRIDWRGFVAERPAYLDALAGADIFVFPSPAEGFPKVVLDATAVGLPVVASPVGALAELAGARLLVPVAPGDAGALAGAVTALVQDPAGTAELRERARSFAAAHTRQAEATRLVGRLRVSYPSLPW